MNFHDVLVLDWLGTNDIRLASLLQEEENG